MTIMLIKVKEQGYIENQEYNLWQLTEEERKMMWKSGTFDLNDISETLID